MTQKEIHTLRIFHGPVNICGIGRYIADWQREIKNAKSDFIVFTDRTMVQNSHQNIQLDKLSSFARIKAKYVFFIHVIKNYDLFHFYFGKTLLPLSIDLPILRLLGKKIIMDYVGSDIRLYQLQIKANPYYHLRTAKSRWDHFDLAKRARMLWQGIWFHLCFAGPALFPHASTSIVKKKIVRDLWINKTLAVPVQQPPPPQNRIPVVIHAPTDVHTKGTPFIEQAMQDLWADGLRFTFNTYQKLPHDELMNEIMGADILVDQLFNGNFGVLATEGMAYGKPVCGYIMPSVRNEIPDLPIVQCTIETIKEQLRYLIQNKGERERIGKESWEFARKHFDRDTIYEELWQLYLTLWKK